MKHLDISVVVCTYNRAEELYKALKSLIMQDGGNAFIYDIIVVDDASTDHTEKIIRDIAGQSKIPVKYILEEGRGIARARNRGISESTGEWIAFFDDDQIAETDWLNQLISAAKKTGADCVGGRMVLDLPSGEPLSTICRAIFGEMNYGDEPIECTRKKLLPSGGNILLRRSVIDTVGSFDEARIYGGEDHDFLARVCKQGLKMWSTPKAIVHHIIPAYRLKRNYLLWTSLRDGVNFAQNDYKIEGQAKTILYGIARLGQALLINVPMLFWARLTHNDDEALGRRCLLTRCTGYTRRTLFYLLPYLFRQEKFFNRLEFRKERTFASHQRKCIEHI